MTRSENKYLYFSVHINIIVHYCNFIFTIIVQITPLPILCVQYTVFIFGPDILIIFNSLNKMKRFVLAIF